ncbi:START domain-containing protein [Bacteroidota bacterium]
MNKTQILVFFLILCISASSQTGWELKRDKNRIVVYTRESSGTTLKEYKVTAEIDSPLSDVFNFLTDLEIRPTWVIKCIGLEIIDTVDGDKIHYHTSYDIPWPLMDRDLVVEAKFSYAEETGMAHLLTEYTELEFPLKDGVLRMPKYREEIFLERMADGKTQFRAEGFADPGGSLPAWVVNMFLVDGIYDSMIKTREIIKNQSKRQVPGHD